MSLSAALHMATDTRRPLLLDGATGTELQKRGVPMDGALWNALATASHPGILAQVHEDYLHAGAQVIITNTFSTSRFLLDHAGLASRFAELNGQAANIALGARERSGRPAWVAGAMSAITFDRDQELPARATARRDFADQARILAAAGVDLIILEMMFDVDLTAAALEGAATTGLPVWVGFSVARGPDAALQSFRNDLGLRDLLAGLDRTLPQAVGIMHSLTQDTGPALQELTAYWQGPTYVYAHSGEFRMPDWQFSDIISPADYAAAAQHWVNTGVAAVGGCCGLGPAHIQALARTTFDD